MALRQQSHNQENINSRPAAKSALVHHAGVPRRAALGEVGNKLHPGTQITCPVGKLGTVAPSQVAHLNEKKPPQKVTNKFSNTQTNCTLPKPGHMGPPQTIPLISPEKKIQRTVVLKKENNTKLTDKTNSVINESSTKYVDVIPKNDISKEKHTVSISSNSYSSKQLTILDPDENSKNEPQMVTEYLSDIFSYLRNLESEFLIRDDFLADHQTQPRMRAVLVNWLVEVHTNFKFYLETLHLCVSIIDRYLQINRNVGRETLQLVGTSAMVVASKYEEMYLPDMSDFVYICDSAFSRGQILKMEKEILKRLDFKFGCPLSVHFLRRYNKIAQVKSDHHTLGKYILELALLDHTMSHIKPSIQAAAACCLSIAILNEEMDFSKVWTPTLVYYTTYEYSDFRSVLIAFAKLISKSEISKFQAIRKKYASSHFAKISLNLKLQGPLIKKLTMTSFTKK